MDMVKASVVEAMAKPLLLISISQAALDPPAAVQHDRVSAVTKTAEFSKAQVNELLRWGPDAARMRGASELGAARPPNFTLAFSSSSSAKR